MEYGISRQSGRPELFSFGHQGVHFSELDFSNLISYFAPFPTADTKA